MKDGETLVILIDSPSGPIAWTSCLIREMTAKYCGKSCVRILVTLVGVTPGSSDGASEIQRDNTNSNNTNNLP